MRNLDVGFALFMGFAYILALTYLRSCACFEGVEFTNDDVLPTVQLKLKMNQTQPMRRKSRKKLRGGGK